MLSLTFEVIITEEKDGHIAFKSSAECHQMKNYGFTENEDDAMRKLALSLTDTCVQQFGKAAKVIEELFDDHSKKKGQVCTDPGRFIRQPKEE